MLLNDPSRTEKATERVKLRRPAIPAGVTAVVGLGLQLSGFTHPIVGIVLMVGGILWAGFYVVPFAFNLLVAAVSERVAAQRTPPELAEGPHHTQEEDAGSKDVRQMLQQVDWELGSLHTQASQMRNGTTFPQGFVLPAIAWGKYHEELACHTDLAGALDKARAVYDTANVVNHNLAPMPNSDARTRIEEASGISSSRRHARGE
jgi:hypothetical protein